MISVDGEGNFRGDAYLGTYGVQYIHTHMHTYIHIYGNSSGVLRKGFLFFLFLFFPDFFRAVELDGEERSKDFEVKICFLDTK